MNILKPDLDTEDIEKPGIHHLKPPYKWYTNLSIAAVIIAIIVSGWTPSVPREILLFVYAFIPACAHG